MSWKSHNFEPGSRVVFSRPWEAPFGDNGRASRMLAYGETYTVETLEGPGVRPGEDIYLVGFPGEPFSCFMFEDAK